MSLTGKDIAEIAHLLDQSQFGALDLTMGDFRLKLRRAGGGRGYEADDPREASPSPAPAPKPAPTAAPAPVTSAAPDEVEVVAPLLGNFYTTPRPGEPAFINVGDRVEPESIIAIIEVMKLMNSVRAGVSGVVTALLVENGGSVEAGQAIIRVRVG